MLLVQTWPFTSHILPKTKISHTKIKKGLLSEEDLFHLSVFLLFLLKMSTARARLSLLFGWPCVHGNTSTCLYFVIMDLREMGSSRSCQIRREIPINIKQFGIV